MDALNMGAVWVEISIRAHHLTPADLGIFTVLVHILGYTFYISRSLAGTVEPNDTTWFIFMYSTFITLVLEYTIGAAGYLLYLPLACAIGSFIVASFCLLRGGFGWPKHPHDRDALYKDIALTVVYVVAAAMYYYAHALFADYAERIEDIKFTALAVFLIFSNWSTFYAFRPIIRDARENPEREHSLAWITWTIAYVLLGITTVWGWFDEGAQNPLMLFLLILYPVSCAYLHGMLAWLARPSRHGGKPVSVPAPAE